MNGRNPNHVTPRVWSKGALLAATAATYTPMQPVKAKLSADRLEVLALGIKLEARHPRCARQAGRSAAMIALTELGLQRPQGLRGRDLRDFALTAIAVETGLLAVKEAA